MKTSFLTHRQLKGVSSLIGGNVTVTSCFDQHP
jgi:hypothetical protein